MEEFRSELEPSVIASWKDEIKKSKKLVNDHKKRVWTECNKLKPPKQMSHFEYQSLENQSKQINLQQMNVDSTVGIEEKRVSGIAQVKFDEIMKCSKSIVDMLESRDEEVLENEHDEIIRKYMREL